MKHKTHRKSASSDLNRGSFVKIYVSNREKEFTLVYPGGKGCKRIRRTFAYLDEAKAERDRVETKFKNRDTLALSLTSRDNESYLMAKDELADAGLKQREYRPIFPSTDDGSREQRDQNWSSDGE